MRLLNNGTDASLKNITIYLTKSEARQMIGYLEQIIDEPNQHFHLDDEMFEHEVTLVVYQENNLASFDARSKRLIDKDE